MFTDIYMEYITKKKIESQYKILKLIYNIKYVN